MASVAGGARLGSDDIFFFGREGGVTDKIACQEGLLLSTGLGLRRPGGIIEY